MKLLNFLNENETAPESKSYNLSSHVSELAVRVNQLNSKKKYTLATLTLARFLKSKKHITILNSITNIIEQEGYVPDDISRYRSSILRDLLVKIAPSQLTDYEIEYLSKMFK